MGRKCKLFPNCNKLQEKFDVPINAFHQGLPYMEKLNEWTSNRLAQQNRML